jgi:nucleoside-diphosphate-sugar epimerase
MRILITGGAGFLGSRLAQALLARGTLTDARGHARAIDRVVLADVVAAPSLADSRVQAMQAAWTTPRSSSASSVPKRTRYFTWLQS